MKYDVFFSIAQTPVEGYLPSEAEMYRNFFDQVQVADELGYGTAWVAESHLSTEVHRRYHENPATPYWEGEIGLNVDILQLSHRIFQRTSRIETGSAIMNILCMGGPVAHAERVAYFMGLHDLDPEETRRVHVGFASGRFDYMNRATGIRPRNGAEEAAGRAWKNKVYSEAAEIFCRLLRGDILSSDQVEPRSLAREDFKTDEDWDRVRQAAKDDGKLDRSGGEEIVALDRMWAFEALKIIPQDWRRELLQLVAGSHDPRMHEYLNRITPCHIFNLSFTKPEVIEATHERMRKAFHPDGGPWKREYMPRTVFCFINEEPGLSPSERSDRARDEARKALSAYWKAVKGTVDPDKVEEAADNALVGNAEDVANQCLERYDPDDRLMLWFDFFNHDNDRVIRNMRAFMDEARPRIEERLQR